MNEQTFNLDRALVAVDSKQALNKQRTQVKRTINAFTKASEATQSACQMLFENVAHCMDAEYQDKAFKLAKKNWHALAGFKNAESFKKETGKNLSPYWSILKWGAEQATAFYTFHELRTAYDNKPKNSVTGSSSSRRSANQSASESADAETSVEADTSSTVSVNLIPEMLELFNRIGSTKDDAQQKELLAVFLQGMEAYQEKQRQALKIKKFDKKGKEKKVA